MTNIITITLHPTSTHRIMIKSKPRQRKDDQSYLDIGVAVLIPGEKMSLTVHEDKEIIITEEDMYEGDMYENI